MRWLKAFLEFLQSRFHALTSGGETGLDPDDPYAGRLAPVNPRRPLQSGAVALDEPDDD